MKTFTSFDTNRHLTYKFTIVMPPMKGKEETKQTNSDKVVENAFKHHWMVIDNTTGEEILKPLQ